MDTNSKIRPALQPFEKPAPNPLNPVCPYCDSDPMSLSFRDMTISQNPAIVVLLVYCANIDCRKVLTVAQRQIESTQRVEIPKNMILH